MFVKTVNSGGHKYLALVKSVRKNGQPTHEVVAKLGRADQLAESENLDKIIAALQRHALKQAAATKPAATLKDISTMEEVERLNYGYIAYRTLWRQFGLDRLLTDLSADRKIAYDYAETVLAMTVNHALWPSSRRELYSHKDRYAGLTDELALPHLYRSLDLLAEHKAALEAQLFNRHRTLFEMKVDVVFFDVTTFYFESQEADALRDFGFGKDGKINEVQVVLALLIDAAGRPISFELFPGNTFEGNTLLAVLDTIKSRFQIQQVIIVADKGLNSKLNLKAIKDRGYDYIVSSRIRHLPKDTQAQVLSESGYETLTVKDVFGIEDEEAKAHVFKSKTLDYVNVVRYKAEGAGEARTEGKTSKWRQVKLAEKLICSWSSKRAHKDKADRERQLDKARAAVAINQTSVLSPHGYKRFIKKTGDDPENVRLKLNEEKIAAEARFDGFAALQCSRTNMDAAEVMRAYRQLLKIEESFRVMKTTLQTRPVFVRTPEHIKGHFVMCFLTFALERELEYRLNKRNIENSPEQIKRALNSMEVSALKIEDEPYYLKGKHRPLGSQIFALLKMKLPHNIQNEPQWKEYIKTV